ncbi:MAG TPA: DMT family transporter [Candidatus Blautia stercorigallinarum]|uniref:DMT family transporter n=1 Tax=Candidatus Blautia stercorigallinarum TaxID=2838501 RepID=A0A9D1PEM6_9FIRM|nr:DMT family transporter [Candidatus Blautia stercorigallinarum]
MSAKHSKNFILLFLTALIWGVAFVAQSVAMDYIGPYTFNAVRSLLGGIVLVPCVFLFGQKKKTVKDEDPSKGTAVDRPGDMITGGLLCGIMLFLSTTLQQVGIQYTTVAKAGFITALYIILVPILGIFLKKRVSFQIWISVVIAIIGLYLLCMKGSFHLGQGDFLMLVCSLCFALHILVIDHFTDKVSGVKLSCIQFFVCGLLSCILMFLFEKPAVSDILSAWLPIVYAGVFSSGVAYTLQIIGQKGTDPTITSLILSLESVVSVLAGWIILGQSLTPREILGCLLMFGAIILAQVAPVQKASS